MNPSQSYMERRSVSDRRKFTYAAYWPERRSGKDRRQMQNKKNDQKVA